MSAFPTLLPLKFKWPEPDRSNIATHCCYFPGSKYIVKIRIFREWEGKKREITWSPSPLWVPPFTNISIGPNSIIYLPIYRNWYTSECCRNDFRPEEFIWNDLKIVVYQSVFYVTKYICTIASHTQISIIHAYTFTVIWQRGRDRDWESGKERGGRGLIGFLWLQLNNIMHILA